jgi:hypothetical protein
MARRIVRSARGIEVDFDLLRIKAQLEGATISGAQELILQKSEDLTARRQRRKKRTKDTTVVAVAPIEVDPKLSQETK